MTTSHPTIVPRTPAAHGLAKGHLARVALVLLSLAMAPVGVAIGSHLSPPAGSAAIAGAAWLGR